MKPDKYHFEKIFSKKEKFVFRYDRGVLRDILRQKTSGKVLDLGCGLGGLSLDLAQKGFEVICVDISETAIKEINKEAKRRNVKINAICRDLEDYKIEEDYDIILVLGVLQFLGEKGKNFVERVQRHTKKGGINIIDAFRNNWLPKGELEKIYSEWKILNKEEYVWEKDNFAKMIYLIAEKRFGGWQFFVEIKKDHVIKTPKTKAEMRKTIRRHLDSIGKTEKLEEKVKEMLLDIKESTKIITSSNIPKRLLAFPKFLKNGKIKQEKAIVLHEKLDELLEKNKKKEAKKIIDESINFLIELWKYGIHEKTFKFYSNLGILNKEIVLIDLFELTDKKEKVEKQIKNKSWSHLEKLKKNFAPEVIEYFLNQVEKKLTIKNLNNNWGIKIK